MEFEKKVTNLGYENTESIFFLLQVYFNGGRNWTAGHSRRWNQIKRQARTEDATEGRSG